MSVRVGLGIATFPFESARAFFRWVDVCEAGGVDSLWQTDRLSAPQAYLEAMSTMAALAGATERVKFGMNAVVVGVRDPLVLAKQCATIDFLSGGRLLPAFGVGAATAPEFRATGREPKERGRRANEALEIMRRLWTGEPVTYAGEFYQYTGATIAPRPVQDPLPLWIGGSSRAAIRRTARLGTGWLAGLQGPEEIAPTIQAIRDECAAVGRAIDDDHYGAGVVFRLGSWDDAELAPFARARQRAAPERDPARSFAVGDAAAIAARLEAYVRAGASKFVLIPAARGDADLMRQTEQLVAEVIPAVER